MGGGNTKTLADMFAGKHRSLVICVWGNTYHEETHITVTPRAATFTGTDLLQIGSLLDNIFVRYGHAIQ